MASDDAYQHQHNWENRKLEEAKILGFRNILINLTHEYAAVPPEDILAIFDKHFNIKEDE